MREILFRGKRVDNGDWVKGFYVVLGGENHCIFTGRLDITKRSIGYEYFKVDPETVGQYTGLTDKNGTKIFEGDIFRFSDEVWSSCYTSCGTEYDSWDVENYGVIGFDEENARFDFVRYKFGENSVEADLHENRNIEFAEFVSDLEIIGNIHDNPELLEVSDNGQN